MPSLLIFQNHCGNGLGPLGHPPVQLQDVSFTNMEESTQAWSTLIIEWCRIIEDGQFMKAGRETAQIPYGTGATFVDQRLRDIVTSISCPCGMQFRSF